LTTYRCYCVGRDGHIRSVNVIESGSDRGARARGAELLDACCYDTVEIWDGARCLGQLTRPDPRASAPEAAAGSSCCGNCAT